MDTPDPQAHPAPAEPASELRRRHLPAATTSSDTAPLPPAGAHKDSHTSTASTAEDGPYGKTPDGTGPSPLISPPCPRPRLARALG